jgi:hypothetical protein
MRAIMTGTIPLGKTTPGRGTEDCDVHSSSELELGVGIRANFTAQANLFVLRGCPFHCQRSLVEIGPKATVYNDSKRQEQKQCPRRGPSMKLAV